MNNETSPLPAWLLLSVLGILIWWLIIKIILP